MDVLFVGSRGPTHPQGRVRRPQEARSGSGPDLVTPVGGRSTPTTPRPSGDLQSSGNTPTLVSLPEPSSLWSSRSREGPSEFRPSSG